MVVIRNGLDLLPALKCLKFGCGSQCLDVHSHFFAVQLTSIFMNHMLGTCSPCLSKIDVSIRFPE